MDLRMNSRALSAHTTAPCALSVVVPIFNEDAVLLAFHRRLTNTLADTPAVWRSGGALRAALSRHK